MDDSYRHMIRAARHNADTNSARIADANTGDVFHATVTTVAPGQAKDGVHALVQVTYRLQATTAAGYPAWYTPVEGDRVLCVVTKDHQLEILHPSVGAPY